MSELIANRYKLGHIIGTGGMSVVYEAEDTLLGRKVAIKMLRSDLARDVNFRERFRREAQNSGKLNHPAIVAVYDTGETDHDGVSTPYIVMELVNGRTLRDIVREDGPLSPVEAARTLIPVCSALQASHDAGIIHRDIKPANIMITNTGAVKIMDFGIARALNDATGAMTQTAAVIGTAQYLSPEQARGKTADVRSDIYSLGCVMYEIITGRPPFNGDTPFAVAYQHVQEDPIPPSEIIGDLSPAAALNVDAVVLTAMAKHPGDRYQSATNMAQDLERLERGAVTQAARHYVAVGSDSLDEAAPATDATAVIPPVPATNTPPTSSFESSYAEEDAPGNRAQKYEPQSYEPSSHRASTKKSNKGLTIFLSFVVVAMLAVGGIFTYDYVANRNSASSTVTIPALESTPKEDAISTLQGLGLNVTVASEASPTIKEGYVIETNPASGSSVNAKSTVTITVSTGKEVIETPDLKNLTTEQASKKLKSLGLELDPVVQEEPSDDIIDGHITSQSPSAGSQLSKGSKVTITVSTGKEEARVPTLTGLNWSQAEENLTSLGFVPIVEYVDSEKPEGTVLSVEDEGNQREKDAEIRVQVSNGNLISMPSITRMTSEDALRTLHDAGWTGNLRRGTPITTRVPTDKDLIATQNPQASSTIRKDQDINIQLYQFSIL